MRRDIDIRAHIQGDSNLDELRVELVERVYKAINTCLNERDPDRKIHPFEEQEAILDTLALLAGWSHGEAALLAQERSIRDQVLRRGIIRGKRIALALHDHKNCPPAQALLAELEAH